jgi:nitrate reductase cytochrome c-type subunit
MIIIFGVILYLSGCTVFQQDIKEEKTTLLPRAFEGAPPLIPHEIEDETTCLECHRLGDNDAPITSHPERVNCVQCHIAQDLSVKPFVENTF